MNTVKHKVSAGFSLVEIMVGLTIGLVTVLIVTQVMAVAEARRRTTSSGADSITNASLGLYTIERDAKNAGYGMASVRASVGCAILYTYNGVAKTPLTLAPVVITDGASGAPDKLQFLASTKNGVTLPTRISAAHATDATNFTVESTLGAQTNDIMLAVPSTLNPGTTWCSLFQMTGSGGTSDVQNATTSLWNPAASIMPAAGYAANDYLINLGTFSDRIYSIGITASGGGTLQLTEFNSANNLSPSVDMFPNIVQLQAVYGKDTGTDNIVDVWNETAPTTAAEWQQVRAIRIALVARSQTAEPGVVTLNGADALSLCVSDTPHPAAVCWRPDPTGQGVKIDVSTNNANWQRYRYRVVETTIPLRNVIWQQ